MNEDALASAIFHVLNIGHNELGGHGPYSYNEDEKHLIIGLDGHLDCRWLAREVLKITVARTQSEG